MRPRSFPLHFDPLKDLNVYYYAQQNSRNTQAIWAQVVKDVKDGFQGGARKVIHLLDNFSAHMIDNARFDHTENLFFPPNMTSVLQPVYAAVGRSFKAVTIYDDVEMMAQALNIVLVSVFLNTWLKTNILEQFLQN